MNHTEFYQKITDVIHRPLTKLEIEFLDIACLPEGLEQLKENLKEGWIETLQGRIPEFVGLDEAKARWSEGPTGLWLYDRNTRTWIIGMKRGSHEHLAGTLYGIYNNSTSAFNIEVDAEMYITKHYGFFVSGAFNSYIPIKDDRYVLTPEEQIFEIAKGIRPWRGI